jgi:hypothetical protein
MLSRPYKSVTFIVKHKRSIVKCLFLQCLAQHITHPNTKGQARLDAKHWHINIKVLTQLPFELKLQMPTS